MPVDVTTPAGCLLVAALVVAGCASAAPDESAPASTSTVPEPDAIDCRIDPDVSWVEEGQTVQTTVQCPVALEAVDAPIGVEVASGEITWTPTLDQAGTHEVVLEAGATTLTWTVGVADAFGEPGNVPVVDPELLTSEYGLDVLHLFTTEALSTEYGDATLVHGGRSYPADLRVRGALSLQYPKPNFTVRLAQPFRSADPAFDGLDRLVLVAGFDDNSLVRNRLAQQLWAEMDDRHLVVPHASVVVYLDGEYIGMYTLLENVNGDYLSRHGLDDDGQLFKANDARADFRLDDDPDPRAGFEKKSGDPPDGPAALGPVADLVEFVAESDDVRFGAEVHQWVDVDEVIDWLAFVSFISAGDSANKNAYWYQQNDGQPFRYVPWDFNHSFGQDFLTVRLPADDQLLESFVAMNGLFERLWADPATRDRIMARYRSLLDGPLSPDQIDLVLDPIVAEVTTNLDRNDRRWSDAYEGFRLWSDRVDLNGGTGEIEYVRQWIAERHAAVQSALDAS